MYKNNHLHDIDIKSEALRAEKKIRKYIRETPLEFSSYLSQLGSCQTYLKLENFQVTGSFKLRGAMNKIISLNKKEKETNLVTASSGNHGAAFAHTINTFGLKGTIYLAENASPSKIESLGLYGTHLQLYGNDCVKAENQAKKFAKKNNHIFISPYNDPKIIGGQGTIGIELERQLSRIDSVLVPVGGGGLISGIAGYLKSLNQSIEIIGCQPKNSPVMFESIKAGKIIDMESKPTISDGTAGGIEHCSITFNICQKMVDDYIIISEEEIKNAILLILKTHYMLIEGAGALAIAGFIRENKRFKNKHVVLIISGSRIGLDTLKHIFCDK